MRTCHVAPTDFAWLLDECPRCFWLKSRGVVRQKDNLPRIFNHIDGCMKKVYDLKALRALEIPATKILEKTYAKSQPIPFEDCGVELVLGGYLDTSAELEDDGLGIYDFKSTDPSSERVTLYRRQLHSYLWCVEHPAKGEGRQVTDLGLICFDAYHGTMTRDGKGNVAQRGKEKLVRLTIDRQWFLTVLESVAKLLGSEDIPPPGETCATCMHYAAVRQYEKNYEKRRTA